MSAPPNTPPSTDRTECIQWFQDWTNFGFQSHPGFFSDWINSDNDTQECHGLTHHQILVVRLFQRILKLENAIESIVTESKDP